MKKMIRCLSICSALVFALNMGTSANLGVFAEESTRLLGDVNEDGNIDISDAYAVYSVFSNYPVQSDIEITEETLTACDVDKDGNVTLQDAEYILVFSIYLLFSYGDTMSYDEIWAMILPSEGNKPETPELLPSDQTISLQIGTVEVSKKYLRRNHNTVSIPFSISNNPGFSYLNFGFSCEETMFDWDSLQESENFSGTSIYCGTSVDYSFCWVQALPNPDLEELEINNGQFASLPVTVSKDVSVGDELSIQFEDVSLYHDFHAYCADTNSIYTIVPTNGMIRIIGDTGDMDDDEEITINDAHAVLAASSRISAGMESGLSAGREECADIDGDGTISIADALYVLRYSSCTAAGKDITWQQVIDNRI